MPTIVKKLGGSLRCQLEQAIKDRTGSSTVNFSTVDRLLETLQGVDFVPYASESSLEADGCNKPINGKRSCGGYCSDSSLTKRIGSNDPYVDGSSSRLQQEYIFTDRTKIKGFSHEVFEARSPVAGHDSPLSQMIKIASQQHRSPCSKTVVEVFSGRFEAASSGDTPFDIGGGFERNGSGHPWMTSIMDDVCDDTGRKKSYSEEGSPSVDDFTTSSHSHFTGQFNL